MHTKPKKTGSWYDTPLGQLYGGETRRRSQRPIADVVAELTRRNS